MGVSRTTRRRSRVLSCWEKKYVSITREESRIFRFSRSNTTGALCSSTAAIFRTRKETATGVKSWSERAFTMKVSPTPLSGAQEDIEGFNRMPVSWHIAFANGCGRRGSGYRQEAEKHPVLWTCAVRERKRPHPYVVCPGPRTLVAKTAHRLATRSRTTCVGERARAAARLSGDT